MTSELCKYVTNGNLRRNVKGKRMVFISMCLGKKGLRLAITIIGILDVICSSDLLTECILVIIEPIIMIDYWAPRCSTLYNNNQQQTQPQMLCNFIYALSKKWLI